MSPRRDPSPSARSVFLPIFLIVAAGLLGSFGACSPQESPAASAPEPPAATTSTTRLDVLTFTAPRTLAVHNSGSAPVEIHSLEISGDEVTIRETFEIGVLVAPGDTARLDLTKELEPGATEIPPGGVVETNLSEDLWAALQEDPHTPPYFPYFYTEEDGDYLTIQDSLGADMKVFTATGRLTFSAAGSNDDRLETSIPLKGLFLKIQQENAS